MDIKIPVLSSSYSDLSVFDFAFKDIAIYDIQSKAFRDYYSDLPIKNQFSNAIRIITEGVHHDYEKKYAIVKLNPFDNFQYEELITIWKFLLLIYPSDLQIEHTITYRIEGDLHGIHWQTVPKYATGEYPGDLLYTSDGELPGEIPEINSFAQFCFERLNQDNYIGFCLENYLRSFSASRIHYQFLELCMALEGVLDATTELTYRLQRTAAVLCGRDGGMSQRVSDNIGKIYTLRSKIIHGSTFSIDSVEEYLPVLKAIVSRTIIEMLIHNVPTKKELTSAITRLGFGQGTQISTAYTAFDLNPVTLYEMRRILTKTK